MATTNAARGSAAAQPSHELDAPPWLRVESTLMATANAIRDAYGLQQLFHPCGEPGMILGGTPDPDDVKIVLEGMAA